MINFEDYALDDLIEEGKLSLVGLALWKQKKLLATLGNKLTDTTRQIVLHAQLERDPDVKDVNLALASVRQTMEEMDACVREIQSLTMQKAEMKAAKETAA
jgi:hypothetical protein